MVTSVVSEPRAAPAATNSVDPRVEGIVVIPRMPAVQTAQRVGDTANGAGRCSSVIHDHEGDWGRHGGGGAKKSAAIVRVIL